MTHYLNTIGRVFNIQRYSIHDGDGIRTLVFCKGCFLRCRWCCNPESQSGAVETMTYRGAGGSVRTETVGRDMTVAEVMARVERDRPYYRRSGGGLTVSGGEALCQPDFTRDLLRAARESGIPTALETTAMADCETAASLLPYLDACLLDIKHTDPVKHARFTGKRNDLALSNAVKIAESGLTRLIVRVPVIPGFNASAGEITAIARFAEGLAGVEEIHLLPYHRYGESKYAALGRVYAMAGVQPPADADMEALRRAVAAAVRLRCEIGG